MKQTFMQHRSFDPPKAIDNMQVVSGGVPTNHQHRTTGNSNSFQHLPAFKIEQASSAPT
jgi:hypothetical protein